MRKTLLIVCLVLLPLCLMAQAQESEASATPEVKKEKKQKSALQVFTGFSGGMMLHAGYLFSDDPRKVFSNTGLGSSDYVKGLPKSGVAIGLGGTLRVHLINHIHLGAEGGMSSMPLRGTGSIRAGWGGAICDVYATWGKVRPMIGLGVGGGVMKRLFVPKDPPLQYVPEEGDTIIYNASYTKTPFFYMDPYVGLEIDINRNMAILLRLDYMLPFGRTKSGLAKLKDDVKWSNFMTPTGPRLYVGIMFGKLKSD